MNSKIEKQRANNAIAYTVFQDSAKLPFLYSSEIPGEPSAKVQSDDTTTVMMCSSLVKFLFLL